MRIRVHALRASCTRRLVSSISLARGAGLIAKISRSLPSNRTFRELTQNPRSCSIAMIELTKRSTAQKQGRQAILPSAIPCYPQRAEKERISSNRAEKELFAQNKRLFAFEPSTSAGIRVVKTEGWVADVFVGGVLRRATSRRARRRSRERTRVEPDADGQPGDLRISHGLRSTPFLWASRPLRSPADSAAFWSGRRLAWSYRWRALADPAWLPEPLAAPCKNEPQISRPELPPPDPRCRLGAWKMASRRWPRSEAMA